MPYGAHRSYGSHVAGGARQTAGINSAVRFINPAARLANRYPGPMVIVVLRSSGYLANTAASVVDGDGGYDGKLLLHRAILAAMDPVAAHGEQPAAGPLAGEHDPRADLALGLGQLGGA